MARLEPNGGAAGLGAMAESDARIKESRSFLQGGDAAYLENLLATFERDPQSVSPEWRAFLRSSSPSKPSIEKTKSPIRLQSRSELPT